MSNLILGYGLLGKEIQDQTGWAIISYRNLLQDGFRNMIDDRCDIINCTAYTNAFDNDRKKHWINNVEVVKELIDICNENKKKLIHISTDYMYSESDTNASEESVPIHNNCWYTYTKLVADALVQLESNDYLICRGTHKKHPFTYEKAWVDQYGNFDYVTVIAGLIIKLIEKGANGVYNVGTEAKTMYDLALQTKPDVLPAMKPHETPGNTTMNIDKLNKFLK